MIIKALEHDLTVCKVQDYSLFDFSAAFYFIGKTDEENSLVCRTCDVPKNTTLREDGWKGFRIQGVLDFSLVGILSKISQVLANNSIGIFAVSTYNTDYILVKKEDFEKALLSLENAGFGIEK
ncbi:MAG: ACT domain-containing protein [Clostridia bacterium]|nr:ACT domain-containing protein [Clostridia bacterium]